MKTIKIIALIGAILFAGLGVNCPWCIVWLPVIITSWWVLSDRDLMARWCRFMNRLGA